MQLKLHTFFHVTLGFTMCKVVDLEINHFLAAGAPTTRVSVSPTESNGSSPSRIEVACSHETSSSTAAPAHEVSAAKTPNSPGPISERPCRGRLVGRRCGTGISLTRSMRWALSRRSYEASLSRRVPVFVRLVETPCHNFRLEIVILERVEAVCSLARSVRRRPPPILPRHLSASRMFQSSRATGGGKARRRR